MVLIPGTSPDWFIEEQRMDALDEIERLRMLCAIERKEGRNEAIEECALVIVELYGPFSKGVAAIRALKDKA